MLQNRYSLTLAVHRTREKIRKDWQNEMEKEKSNSSQATTTVKRAEKEREREGGDGEWESAAIFEGC